MTRCHIFVRAALAGCIAFCVSAASGTSPPPSSPLSLASASTNTSGIHLLRLLTADHPDANVILSPIGITQALAMALSGAGANTEREIRAGLSLVHARQSDAVIGIGTLRESLLRKTRWSVFQSDNSAWNPSGYRISDSYISAIHSAVGAEGYHYGSPEEGRSRMNKWITEKTQGKISESIPRVDPDARLTLINTVYFKGIWRDLFNRSLNFSKDFHLSSGKLKKVVMMRNGLTPQNEVYKETRDFQAVRLWYRDSRTWMAIYLPRMGLSPAILSSILDKNGEFKRSNWGVVAGTYSIPKFSVQSKFNITPSLQKMGIRRAFQNNAEFSKIGKGIWLSNVAHDTLVSIDENGTEAAAATVEIYIGSMGPQGRPFNMVVDRPFLFTIQDDPSGAILFAGCINDP